MPRLLLALLVASLPLAALATASPSAKPPVITSQAQLNRYLHDTPIEATPLAPLSPGGRKRFLHSLVWGKHGLGGFSIEDIRSELTHPQAVRLLALLGAQEDAKDVGLSASEQQLRKTERADAAKVRKCVPSACPESRIEQHYDELVVRDSGAAMPSGHKETFDQRYDRLFAMDQTRERLHSTSAPDLRLLVRAANRVAHASPTAAHIDQLELDVAEMQRRGMAQDGHYASLYRLFVSQRQFDKAQALIQQHPGMDVGTLPVLHQKLDPKHRGHTALVVDQRQRNSMTRRSYDLSAPLLIVAVTDQGCHFCEETAHAVQADPKLRQLFADHGFWLASQNNDYDYATAWNKRYPSQPMHIAWQNSEWPMLNWDALPVFYVFRQGIW